MEGLIKGLIDVALGHDNKDDEDSNPQARDERSRSSWAQVSNPFTLKEEFLFWLLFISLLHFELRSLIGAEMHRLSPESQMRVKRALIELMVILRTNGIDRYGFRFPKFVVWKCKSKCGFTGKE